LQTSASEKHHGGRVPYRGNHGPATPLISKNAHQHVKYEDPYKYEPTDFDFPAADFEGVTKFAPSESPKPILTPKSSGNQRPDTSRNRVSKDKDNQVEKFVPFFIKEVLAKSFLNEPERYLAEYRARERNLKKSRDKYFTTDQSEVTLADMRQFQPRASTTPRSKDFPWNPNNYDNNGKKFEGGYVFNKDELSYDLDHKQQYNYLLGETFDMNENQRSEKVIRF